MIGHNVWQHMTDVESGIIARSLEKAMREELDVVFEYYSEPRKCWCVICTDRTTTIFIFILFFCSPL